MTKEDILKVLSTEEGKNLFNEIAKEQRYLMPNEIDGLVRSRDNILAEKKKLQDELKKYKEVDYSEIEEKAKTIEEREMELKKQIEEFELMKKLNNKKQIEPNESNSLFSNMDEINKFKSTYEAEKKAIEQRYEKKLKEYENKSSDNYNQLLESYNRIISKYDSERIENTINYHFDQIGVAEYFRPVLREAFKIKAKAKYNEENDVRDIFFIKKDNNVELEINPKEFFNEFANSEEGKYYIQAPKNAGGGAIGNANSNKTNNKISSENFYRALLSA